MLHDTIQVEFLDVAVRADNSEDESNVLAYICDVNKIFHANRTNAIIEIVDQSGVAIDKYNAALACLRICICEFDHVLCFSTPFVSY